MCAELQINCVPLHPKRFNYSDYAEDMRRFTLTNTLEYHDVPQILTAADEATDTYQLEVPARDRITFSTLIACMGWPALSLRKTIGKVAAL